MVASFCLNKLIEFSSGESHNTYEYVSICIIETIKIAKTWIVYMRPSANKHLQIIIFLYRDYHQR